MYITSTQNKQRAFLADTAFAAYITAKQQHDGVIENELPLIMQSFLADLRHYSVQNGFNFDHILTKSEDIFTSQHGG